MEITFDSQDKLFERVLPALKIKRSLMKRKGYNFFSEEDIFNCLKISKWKNENELMLCDIIDDILNISEVTLASSFVPKNFEDTLALPKLK